MKSHKLKGSLMPMQSITMNLVPGETRAESPLTTDGLAINVVVPDGLPPCSGNINIIYANGVTGHTMSAVLSATQGGPALSVGSDVIGSVNPTIPFFLGGKVYPGGYYATLKAGTYVVTVLPKLGAVEAGLVINLHQYKS